MASNINQNGNFHTPLSPMRFQASMGKEIRRNYKDGKNMVRLSLAKVTQVNYKYNTVEVAMIKSGDTTTHNSNDNGKFSARLPVQFGGTTPEGNVYGSNTLVTVGSLVLIGFLDGSKNNPIVLNIYGTTDNQSMLTRTTYTGADESDEDLQQELWQLFTLYPSMTYKNIDGHGNQEITFPGKTFFYATADNNLVNDVYFDYNNLPSSTYANGDSIEPVSPDAPNMLYVHQAIYDNHRLTFFIKQDGTLRIGSRHVDGGGVTFMQMNTDGSFKIMQANDTIDPELESTNFSSFSIEENGTIILAAGEHTLMIGENGILFDGSEALSGSNLDLSDNQTVKDIQGNVTKLQEATTTDGIMNVVTGSTGWTSINNVIAEKNKTYTSQPQPPYNLGDTWETNGQIYVCINPQPTGSDFTQADWELASDVTAKNTSNDTSNVNGTTSSTVIASITSASNVASSAQSTASSAQSTASSAQSSATAAQNTANLKSRTFTSTPVPPYSIGDLWQKSNGYYTAIEPKLTNQTFDALDWVKSADITADNTSNDTTNVNGTASGTVITNITSATNSASAAQTTANSKAKTYTVQPTVPYNVGDVYKTSSGQIYVCMSARATGSYTASDWILASDITSNNTAADTSKVNGTTASTVITNITNAQNTANAKAQTYTTQPATPYSEGDIWKNGSSVYVCTVSRASGSYTASDWAMAGDITANNTSADSNALGGTSASTISSNITGATNTANTAQTTANSKAKTFTSQPVPPYNAGDIWKNGAAVYVTTVTRASGSYTASDWILSGDVTSSNTAADTTKVNGTTSSTVITNITTAQNTANSANTLATSKAKGFISQPVPPYNTGDVWNNSGSVYVCTTAKATGTSYALSDWTLVGDVTANNTSANSNALGGSSASTVTGNITSAQNTANAKAQGFVTQPIPPYNVGDVWSDNGTVYSCTTSRGTGSFQQSDWTLMGDVTGNNTSADTNAVGGTSSSTVLSNISGAQNTASSASSAASAAQGTATSAQTIASSKTETFVSQPVPPYNKGDIWIDNDKTYVANISRPSTATFLAADWNLAADVTSQNTSADTGAVNGTASTTVITNITAAQNTANSKAYSFLNTPVPPYNVGDMWNNNGKIYTCNTAKLNTGVFAQSDWTLSGDVTASNTSADTAKVNGTTSSTVITNITTAQNTANSANTAASTAQTTATSKAKGFITQPVPPYSTGDIWNNSGTIYICTTAKATGTSYALSDWTLSGDVTANNTSANSNALGGTSSSTISTNITNAQNTASSKAKGFITQPAPPYSTGDIWNNNGTVYICTTARSTGSYTATDWKLSGDVTASNTSADTSKVNGTTSSTVITNITTAQNTANSASTSASTAQTTANSKAQGFISQPVPPYNTGDVWNSNGTVYICTTAKASGTSFAQSDWTLSGDVTANNTAKDTSAVNGTTASTVITNITTAQNTANSASTSASNAQSTATAAQTTASSKAEGFISQPVPPYNTGDVWNNNGTVYLCTTAKASGTSFSQADWTLAGDVTANNTSADTANINGTTSSTVITNITTAQNTANSANTAASSAQTTANSANTAASNAQTSANTAQTTANSKAKTFTSQPTPPYSSGDMWKNGAAVYVSTVTRSSGSYTASDWVLSGDVTANNTSADTSKVNGTTSSTVITNITTAQNTANSASTSASNAQSTANTAQSTASSKAQGFISQPVPPYNTGDVWNNSGTVYICTTAKATGTAYALSDWTLSGDITANNTAANSNALGGTSSSTISTNITTAQNTANSASTSASNAQTSANTAQTTANSKAKTFTSTPTIPYSVGDIYKNGSTVYICATARSTGSYTASDWTLSGDVTSLNTAADTSKVNGTTASTVITNITTAQNTANSANTAASSAQTSANSAQTSANNAQTTANSKAQGFIAQPVPPYNLGDVWNNNGTVYICTTAEASTGTFSMSDWTLSGDVTASNTAADTSKVNGTTASTVITNITTAQNTANSANTSASNAQTTANSANTAASNAQTTANSKAKTFTATPTIPYSVGDIYKNGQTTYICTTARSSGSYTSTDWTLSGDVTSLNTSADTSKVNGTTASTVITNITTAQNTANAKAQTFTATPTVPYNVGDIYKNGSTVYVCTTAKATGGTYASSDWTLVGDVTSQNTAKDTSAVNGTTSSTVITNITNAQNSASSASTSASNAQTSANTAQTTANSKAQTFTNQPAPPYNVGDMWKSGAAVYVCTTAKATGGTYASTDWVLSGDVTSSNTANDTTNVNGTAAGTVITNITSASNSASAANTAASNAQTTANSANTAASNAQTTANSKAKTFTSTPTIPYSVGDLYKSGSTVYICTTARSSGSYTSTDFVLAGDVTSLNTAADTSKVNGTTASTVITNITTAQNTANSASTSASSANTAASNAQTSANNAQSTANSKAQTFTSTPVPPYNVGDLYNNGSTVYICTTAKASGGTYVSTDFVLAGDVTANNTSADTNAVNGTTSSTVITNITTAQNTANSASTSASSAQTTANSANTAASNAQTTANSKSKTFTATPTIPYSVGDLYKNGSTVYICTTARSSGSYTSTDFVLAGDVTANNTSADTSKVNGTTSSTVITNITTAQNTANSKSATFTSTPVPPYSVGDLYKNGSTVYICTTAKATGGTYASTDFVLAGDVTANNTAADTSAVNGTTSSTVITNITTAQNTANSASTSASSASTAASNAQTTANSKSATFTSTPVPPYNLGDIYKNGSTVYICTTAKATGGTYASTDFVLVGDVTGSNTSADTSKVNGTTSSTVITNITTAQNTANSKAKTFTSTPVTPYSLGDLYKNGTTVYMCTTARASGSYVSTDFTLVGDVTSQNTAKDTAAVNGTTSSTVITNITNAQNTANSASTSATTANNAVNNLVIGGRNYILNTFNMNDLTNWQLSVGSSIVATLNVIDDPEYNGVINLNVTTNSSTAGSDYIVVENTGITLPNGKFTVGNQYTLSFMMKNAFPMYVMFADGTGANPVAARSATIPVNSSWERIVYSFTATATGNTPLLYFSTTDTTDTGNVYITEIQLEDGSKASGYSPAPEDINNQVNTLSDTVFNITTGVFPTDMGNAIIQQVTNSSDYSSDLDGLVDKASYSTDQKSTATAITNAQNNAETYADNAIKVIDFSPYVTNTRLTENRDYISAQFSQSGGVNLLVNSVGYSATDFWSVSFDNGGSVVQSTDPTLAQYGSNSGFAVRGATMTQTVSVTPGIAYTLGVIVNKYASGSGFISLDDGAGNTNTLPFQDGTAYPWNTPQDVTVTNPDGTTTTTTVVTPYSISVTPASTQLTVTIYASVPSVSTQSSMVFTCVMLNVGNQPFNWQMHMGEAYNTNVTFNDNGIQVSHTESDGTLTGVTVMSYEKFAGYRDQNNDGTVDVSDGSADEIFRVDQDTFSMKSATIGPVKIIQVTSGGYNGIAFIKSS